MVAKFVYPTIVARAKVVGVHMSANIAWAIIEVPIRFVTRLRRVQAKASSSVEAARAQKEREKRGVERRTRSDG